MEQRLATYFETRPRSELEVRQKQQSLYLFTTLAFVLSIFLAGLNYFGGATNHSFSLITLSLLCIPLLIQIKRGKYYYSCSVFFTLITLATVNINLLIAGTINDSGIVVYPLLIIASTFLLGERAALCNFILATASLIAIFVLLALGDGFQGQKIHYMFMELTTIVVLLCFSALLVWVIIKNDEENLLMVTSAQEELSQSYEQTLESWARVLEYRDRETEGHCRRVRVLSEWLGRRLGLPEEEIHHLGYGALLHDIGKLAIPDAILLKKGPLNNEERQVMDRHTDYAHELLSQIPFLAKALSVPYCHHERWDGMGYPQGLKASTIPIMARIFTVVDQWEALTSDRPYRKAWPEEEAIEYMEQNRGVIFDPLVVDAFLEAQQQGELKGL